MKSMMVVKEWSTEGGRGQGEGNLGGVSNIKGDVED